MTCTMWLGFWLCAKTSSSAMPAHSTGADSPPPTPLALVLPLFPSRSELKSNPPEPLLPPPMDEEDDDEVGPLVAAPPKRELKSKPMVLD
jgi:hypothetical protein